MTLYPLRSGLHAIEGTAYAHLTAFHTGDQAFAHLHPQGQVSGDHGGPTLSFHTTLAKPGDWRLFVQFHTGGVLHTTPVTCTWPSNLAVGSRPGDRRATPSHSPAVSHRLPAGQPTWQP
jgi:hypothetical protein